MLNEVHESSLRGLKGLSGLSDENRPSIQPSDAWNRLILLTHGFAKFNVSPWHVAPLLPSNLDEYSFFNGWKRKIGCGLLLVAVLFTIGWGRSRIVADSVWFRSYSRQQQIIAVNGMLFWWGSYSETPRCDVKFGVQSSDELFGLIKDVRQSRTLDTDVQFAEWAIPYWSLILPLVITSACLILQPQSPKSR